MPVAPGSDTNDIRHIGAKPNGIEQMRILIVYVSVHHGNTERVARTMANVLAANLVQVREASAAVLEQYDLIGFGSGIYFGRHHENILHFVDKLPVLRDKKAFIFSTSGLRKIPLVHDFDRSLKRKLQRKGFSVIAEFSCRGLDTYRATRLVGGINRGRPNDEDLKRAAEFARSLKNSGHS
jgi:flavodoxin